MAAAMDVMSKPEDLDAQATIHDFQDYTEYLPADLNRSLTLIHKLDEAFLTRADKVHTQLIQYEDLPKTSLAEDSQAFRSQISYDLGQALSARESATGEADRLYEMIDRHYNRLASVATKLHALPKPPSRDPTPVPKSPRATRKSPPPRITLRLDGARTSAGRSSGQEKTQKKRSRRILVPGEVLPPRNPDSPTPFDDTDWESIPQSPLPMPTSRVGGSRRRSSNKTVRPRIRPPKPPKQPKERIPRPPRPPGTGTNVHSQVAGISTSNALSLLVPPPENAKLGSEHAPWMRLTEYEMALLRKRMKKNAIWTPSETMIRRELADAGRGPENYQTKKAEAEEAGEEFLDVDNIANSQPGKPLGPGEISTDSLGLVSANLSNRGMKLNEAKKLKREQMLAASLAETEQVAKHIEDIGSGFKALFSKPPRTPLDSTLAGSLLPNGNTTRKEKPKKKKRPAAKEEPKEAPKPSPQKRKREETPRVEAALPALPEPAPLPIKQPSKKRKTGQTQPAPLTITTTAVTSITTTVPLAAPAPSPPKRSPRSKSVTPSTPLMPAPEKPKSTPAPPTKPTPPQTAGASRPRRVSLTLNGPAPPPASPPLSSSRPPSRAASRRGSTGPPSATISRDHLHRKSATPVTPPPHPPLAQTAAARRSKRPIPGAVVESGEGGAAVSVGKRRHAPKKKIGGMMSGKRGAESSNLKDGRKEDEMMEEVDPNEPRYCVCGDVSYGEMICCDDPDCKIEWFHFPCVGLTENPPRRKMWYCPDCAARREKREK